MLLRELASFSGTYVAVRPTSATLALLSTWAAANGVTLDPGLHTTVLYSRNPVNVEPNTDEYQAQPLGFEVFGDKVVMKLVCPALSRRHEQLMNAGGTHDFESYTPHISITGDCDYSKWSPITFGLLLGGEYSEPLSQ